MHPYDGLRTSLIGFLAVLITTGPTAAQPAGRTTAVDRLRTLEAECDRAFSHERALAVQWALDNDVPMREVLADGRITEIVSVTGNCPSVLTTFNTTAADSISADEVNLLLLPSVTVQKKR